MTNKPKSRTNQRIELKHQAAQISLKPAKPTIKKQEVLSLPPRVNVPTDLNMESKFTSNFIEYTYCGTKTMAW